jgi:hypothetical protein
VLSASSPPFDPDGGGAAIGAPAGGDCRELTFRNGTYVVRGGLRGAGIGSSSPGTTYSKVGSIRILDGAINAIGGLYGAGIGSGGGGLPGGISRIESIYIESGDVVASSLEYGAAIGAGGAYNCNTSVGTISIPGGVFVLAADYGAAIGSGSALKNLVDEVAASHVSTINISNGRFELFGDKHGSGIGAGFSYFGRTSVDSIDIIGGDFVVTGGRAPRSAPGAGTQAFRSSRT